MEQDPPSERERAAFREFAQACRAERDRIARAALDESDRRFESSLAERAAAESLAARLLATFAR